MPRKPTGRPRGRPPGSGQLGEEGRGHKRLTVRIPTELYDALEAVAEQEHYTREAPELARTVRRALEHYLSCPHRRQTGIAPYASLADNGQTINVPEALGDIRGQTENVPVAKHGIEEPRDEKRQTKNIPAVVGDNTGQTEIPPYDTAKFYLGKLCPKRHEYGKTGQSLLLRRKGRCRQCENEADRNRPSRKKKA
jgi:predicted transcriptional regulator